MLCDGYTSSQADKQYAETSTIWRKLTNRKEFSRILYPNPVCLLGTWSCSTSDGTASVKIMYNAMVLSWLSAANNEGRFIFSLNRSRYSAELIKENSFFSLSIPVEGMEQLLRDTGCLSGRFGSKFGQDLTHRSSKHPSQHTQTIKNKHKRKQVETLRSHGVPALERVPMTSPEWSSFVPLGAFGIKDSVARLLCRVDSYNNSLIDDSHMLIVADIIEGMVRADYWDDDRNLFSPQVPGLPSYLTFLGSQRFGSVQATTKDQESVEEG